MFEGFRLFTFFKPLFGLIAPVFAHICTDVFHVVGPIRATKHVDTQFAENPIASNILIICLWLHIDARSNRHKVVEMDTIINLLNLSQTIEHGGCAD